MNRRIAELRAVITYAYFKGNLGLLEEVEADLMNLLKEMVDERRPPSRI